MINVSIDLTKIDKSKIKEHKNGSKYYNFIVAEKTDKGGNPQPDQWGNTHTVYESQSKEEREAKKPKNYIGNGKEWKPQGQQQKPQQETYNAPPSQVDDLPF